jgi:alpha-L-arabinofuranosidase
MKVTRGGETLFAADLSQGTKGWRLHGGNWSVRDGALQQRARGENIRAFAGDRNWSNYTYTLKARKISGEEGFLIPFLVQNESAKAWWNIGGWGNSRHGLELDGIASSDVPGKIETGRWYDIRIELQEARIKCFLDDKLINDVAYPKLKSLYAVAGRSRDEVVLKVVNVAFDPQEAEIRLNGCTSIRSGTAIVLASESPEDENTLEEPFKVSPKVSKLAASGTTLRHTFPANSVTVLRLQAK